MNGRVLGTGIDLVECERIARSMEKFGDRFLDRIFLPAEVAYARAQKFPERHLAARFAAKEAASKAFGTGIGSVLGWREMEVRRDESGAPFMVLHGGALDLLRERGASAMMISLTHTDHYAAATAILISA
ncbi:MAG: holo-ACP synthase [Candidatus Methylacidiphilales bacterium]|nr:holo-ACP synthase [Candidatus Methylacidiphilales bacterium]